jgi:hypothetical protein
MNWPMTIAVGVKRRPRGPKGPRLDRREYKKRPTTTVGSERSVLKKVMMGLLKGNS